MQRIILPATTLQLSRLSFGTASLHHLYTQAARQILLQSASDLGITHFDTSPYYGYGVGEYALGKFLAGKKRENLTIATKIGLYAPNPNQQNITAALLRKVAGKFAPQFSKPVVDWTVAVAARSLRRSLQRLRTEYVDFLFLHEPVPSLLNTDEFLRWLEAEHTAGYLRYWGLAGLGLPMKTWLEANHSLAQVIQTKDSVGECEADFVTQYGRPLQLTYGYLSAATRQTAPDAADKILQQALQRNRTGSIIFSTRKVDRLQSIAQTLATFE